MGDLLIRNIPDEMRQGLAKVADADGLSLSDAAKQAIAAGLRGAAPDAIVKPRNALEAIREALGDSLATDEEHEEFMRIIEEGRRHPDRPPPDLG
ncbi:MAG: plasmid stabilization protein [Rhizobiaceae bacterium]